MKNNQYLLRLIDSKMDRMLHSIGCVLVLGPKFCGKSTTCKRFSKSKVELKTANAIALALSDPKSALIGENPHLIDEWQKAPAVWDLIRDDLDNDYEFGKYILTGSTTPLDPKKIQHSGAGRIASLVMKPLSLFESKESNGMVSLKALFSSPLSSEQILYAEQNEISLADIAFLMCRGGWPVSVLTEKEYALDVTLNYFNGLFNLENESDEFAEFLSKKDIDLLNAVLKSYARNISTQAKKTSMAFDIKESGIRKTLSDITFNTYQKVLKDLFIIYDMPAWNLNLRSTVSVRSAPTHHFFDTSIALTSLGITPDGLLSDLRSMGMFFEDFAIRDLSIYADSIDATLKHYRDSNGGEVDAIVMLKNGDYGAIEIKIASEKNIAEGVHSLEKFEKKMSENNLRLPSFKMVLTSHGACYKTKDNINIVPINCLKD